MNQALNKAIEHWQHIAPIVAYPRNDKELDALASRVDKLLDMAGDDEKHPLMGLIDFMGNVIASYEKAHAPKTTGTAIDALQFLINAHQLHQSDFPEIASQGIMSEILNGKRTLNLRQIKSLAKRFHVDLSTFIDD